MFGLMKRRSIKNYIINPNFQFKYVINYICVGLIAIGLNYLFVLRKLNLFVDQLALANITDPEIKMNLASLIQGINMQSLFAFLTTVAFAIFFAIFMSHRIAGAAYAIEKYIKEIKNGDYDEKRKLRKNDDLQALMTELNELAKVLNKKK